MGLFTIFGTSLRAMTAYSGAMGIIANNIANSSNENYSRQRVSFETLSPDKIGGFETGRGIGISAIEQVVSQVLERRMTDNNQLLGYASAQFEYISNVDNLLADMTNAGLNSAISDFYNSWSALSADPANTSARQNVLRSADQLVRTFGVYGETITNTQNIVNNEIKQLAPEINSMLQQVADLNLKIQESETDALNLKDERRRILSSLSEKIDVTYIETADQHVQVFTKAGLPLVNGVNVATLDVLPDPTNDNLFSVTYQMGNFTPTDITSLITGGRMGGLLSIRDEYITSYRDELDDLAYTLTEEINGLHSQGYNLDGNFNMNFFEPLAAVENASRQLSISADVLGQPRALAIAGNLSEIPGGNDIALQIADKLLASDVTFQDGSTNSFTGYFADFVSLVGNNSNLAKGNMNFTESIQNQLRLEKNQTSGVSIDEEQINLIKFQAAYQAAGKMIGIANDIINSLFDGLA